jgi:hypothetical protein
LGLKRARPAKSSAKANIQAMVYREGR